MLNALPPGTAATTYMSTVSTSPVLRASNKTKVMMWDPEPKAPIPTGVHLTQYLRVGDSIRDEYMAHLNVMFSDGHLDREEFDARVDAALKAETREELEVLTSDLPPVPLRVIPQEKVSRGTIFAPLFLSVVSFVASFSMDPLTSGVFLFLAAIWGVVFILVAVSRITKQ